MWTLRSLKDTETLARYLARALPPGSLVVLRGPLGGGKTTLVGSLVRTLGFSGRVTSPTYTLIHEYPTPEGLVVHADAYRLEDPSLLAREVLPYRGEARLILVEWGDPEAFEADYLLELTLAPEGRVAQLFHLHPREKEGI
ncbi:MAG: tRNA (adenosine(37)-N6)-threonylcarbamoyltransferase complex ATPase subunit type 1 TsaE [Thermaceae bacterium]